MKWLKELTTINLMAIALVAATTPIARAQIPTGSVILQAGCKDNFNLLLPETPCSLVDNLNEYPEYSKATQSPQLQTLVNYFSSSISDFDEEIAGQAFAHTFDLAQHELAPGRGTIVSAKLWIRLKAFNSRSENDVIALGFVDNTGIIDTTNLWGAFIGTYTSSIPTIGNLLPYPWLEGTTTDIFADSFFLDLANLPLSFNSSNLLSTLDEKRFLDIVIANNTAVDHITLELQTQVPEPSSVLGLIGLTALGSLLRISKRGKVIS